MKSRASFSYALFSLLSLILTQVANAGSATWSSSPLSSYWSNSSNWTPATVPNGPNDVATFDASTTTLVYPEAFHTLELNSIVFNPGASAFTIASDPGSGAAYVSFTLSGPGIINNSGILQNFVVAGVNFNNGGEPNTYVFTNSATAGGLTQFSIYGANNDEQFGGYISFLDTSTASSSIINNVGGASTYYPGVTYFYDSSSAGNATINNNVSTSGRAGECFFYNTSTAGNAVIINNPGPVGLESGFTAFRDSSDAANSTITCNSGGEGGILSFEQDSSGGTARVIVFGNGELLIGAHNAPGVTVGSIEGDGNIFLGANNLTVGSNKLSTSFTGVIQEFADADVIQETGSLTKIGTGTLTLTGANTYTGGTSVEAGLLALNNSTGSGTGTGTVQVNAGTLSGRGTIAGAAIVGTGNGAGAFLAPGANRTGTLTIQNRIIFKADATYTYTLNTRRAEADELIANGVKINPGASFSVVGVGNRRLAAGTVFIAISNTAATAISGTFTNLPDGGTITIGRNTFQADYEGGDGNDLTLTVVP